MCEFEINLKEILKNFNEVKNCLDENVKVCVVVKANAYGFGAGKICQLLNYKADYFAVARLCEFLKIREIVSKPVLILSPLSENEMRVAVSKNAEISISDVESLVQVNKIAKRKNKIAKIHVALDTGMNRFGIKTEVDLKKFLKLLKKMENVQVVGTFSHLYDAENEEKTSVQRDMFLKFKKMIEKQKFHPIFHFANSVGLKDKSNQFDMVRLGIDLYLSKNDKHKLKSNILLVKEVKKGETISYGGTFRADKNMRIAICSGGYADGISRSLSSRGDVLISGKRASIVGTICMDVFMCDITEIEGVKVGDEVVIFGSQKESAISVCEIASKCDTISYEIFTRISERVKRVYRWR